MWAQESRLRVPGLVEEWIHLDCRIDLLEDYQVQGYGNKWNWGFLLGSGIMDYSGGISCCSVVASRHMRAIRCAMGVMSAGNSGPSGEPSPGIDPKTGCKFKAKGGTQIIDRAWRFLKERIVLNQHSRVGTPLLGAKIRSAQCEYWYRNADLWLEAGTLRAWPRSKFLT